MRSAGYELEDGLKCVVHSDGDYTGRAIWTIVKNNERIVEVEEDIELVQNKVLDAQRLNMPYVDIDDIPFSVESIASILEGFTINRIMYMMEDGIYNLTLDDLTSLESAILAIGSHK